MATTSLLIKHFSLEKVLNKTVSVKCNAWQTKQMTVYNLLEQDVNAVYSALTYRTVNNKQIKCLQWKGIVIVGESSIPYELFCDLDEFSQLNGMCYRFNIFIRKSLNINVNAFQYYLPFKTAQSFDSKKNIYVLSGSFDAPSDLCISGFAIQYLSENSKKTFRSKEYLSNEIFDTLKMFVY